VELMQQIAAHTTAYAHTRGAAADWQTSASELYAFLGVHIFMGICPLPQWHMYWSAEFQQPFVAAAFRRDRFEQLLRYFHVAPPHDAAAARDPFSRVRPLIRALQLSFGRMYSPTQPLTVDECIVGFKGRHEAKQYIKSKLGLQGVVPGQRRLSARLPGVRGKRGGAQPGRTGTPRRH
jgi:hypothetical protein